MKPLSLSLLLALALLAGCVAQAATPLNVTTTNVLRFSPIKFYRFFGTTETEEFSIDCAPDAGTVEELALCTRIRVHVADRVVCEFTPYRPAADGGTR